MTTKVKKPYRGLGMEGMLARWYARNTGKDLEPFRQLAGRIAGRVSPGADILEVAPGPGYLAIELAKLGHRVVGLDVSRSFVGIAGDNARRAGIPATFVQGDAAYMPLEANTFDFIVCRAAFKNFSEPVEALREMHRVLRPGGQALIIDLRHDASPEAINDCVKGMGLGFFNRLLTRLTFKYMLVKRAYTQEQFRDMAVETPFKGCDIQTDPLGLEASLTK